MIGTDKFTQSKQTILCMLLCVHKLLVDGSSTANSPSAPTCRLGIY